jgi:hypothetical protein
VTTRHLLSRLILPLTFLALTAAILSCAPVESGPRAWIDWPRDGYRIEPGTTLSLICHAYAEEGVAEVRLAVGPEPYDLGQPVQPGEKFVQMTMEWERTEPGDYLLSVTAFDMTSESSNPAHVTITVTGEEPSLILTPPVVTTPLTPTLEGPSVTPPAEIPTATTTPVTPTPTGTSTPAGTPPPPPPTIVSFEANPASVELGQCTTLSWAAEGVINSVWLDGEGVGDHDSRQRCPQATTAYILRAVGPGGETTATLQVPVTEPPTHTPTHTHTPSPTPDTQGPPAPSQIWPVGGINLLCDAPQDVFTLEWASVSDPSGIGRYHIAVQVRDGSTWKDGKFLISVVTNVTTGLACSNVYRWQVRAVDGADNEGSWSGWAEFVLK